MLRTSQRGDLPSYFLSRYVFMILPTPNSTSHQDLSIGCHQWHNITNNLPPKGKQSTLLYVTYNTTVTIMQQNSVMLVYFGNSQVFPPAKGRYLIVPLLCCHLLIYSPQFQ